MGVTPLAGDISAQGGLKTRFAEDKPNKLIPPVVDIECSEMPRSDSVRGSSTEQRGDPNAYNDLNVLNVFNYLVT
jgi:hypothetical protein